MLAKVAMFTQTSLLAKSTNMKRNEHPTTLGHYKLSLQLIARFLDVASICVLSHTIHKTKHILMEQVEERNLRLAGSSSSSSSRGLLITLERITLLDNSIMPRA